MSEFNYNKKRYLNLLKLKSSQDKILTSIEESELHQYSLVLDRALDWETREQYIDLLEKLISEEISPFQFYIQFKERNELNGEVFDSLQAKFFLLSPHQKSEEFYDFILEILNFCNSYTEIFDSVDPSERSESFDSEFRKPMEEIYLKIQEFLNEE